MEYRTPQPAASWVTGRTRWTVPSRMAVIGDDRLVWGPRTEIAFPEAAVSIGRGAKLGTLPVKFKVRKFPVVLVVCMVRLTALHTWGPRADPQPAPSYVRTWLSLSIEATRALVGRARIDNVRRARPAAAPSHMNVEYRKSVLVKKWEGDRLCPPDTWWLGGSERVYWSKARATRC